MPGIFLGLKFQAIVFFGFAIGSSVGPPRHVYFKYPPWGEIPTCKIPTA